MAIKVTLLKLVFFPNSLQKWLARVGLGFFFNNSVC